MGNPDSASTSAPAPLDFAVPQRTDIALLQRQLEFQRLLGEVSAHFINLPAEEIDWHINQALGRVASFLGFNLAAISKFSGQDSGWEVTHIWTAEGLPPIPPGFTELDFPWATGRIAQGHGVYLTSLDDLPLEAQPDRQTYERHGVRSVYNWPLQVGGAVVGILSFASVAKAHGFPTDFEQGLKLLAQVMASSLARARDDRALRESEARLSLAADAAAVGLWRLDPATGTFWLTNKTRELFGLAADEVVTLERFLSLVHPDDQERVRQTVQAVMQSQEMAQVEYRIVQTDGSLRWILSQGRAHCNTSGHAKDLTGVSVDISERKQLADRLQSAATEWQATFDSINDLVMLLDPEYRILRANAATARFLALPMERIVGSSCFTLMHGTSCPIDSCPCQKTFQARQSSQQELFHAGTGKWLLVSTDPIQDAVGNITGAVHVGRDITAPKRSEEALRASEQLNRATFEQAAVGMAHVGTDGRWLRVNEKLCAIVGYPPDELMKLTFQDVTHPEDLETDLNFVRQVLSGEIKTYSMEKRYVRRDRSVVWVNLTVSLVRSAAGDPLHFISVVQDITEHKRAEAVLRDLSGRLINAQEQERVRLARELHDGLSQNLALQAVELELLSQRPPTSPAEITRRTLELSAQMKKLSSEVHRISHNLHPSKLTQLGLAAAIAELCHAGSSAYHLPIAFDHNTIPRALPSDVALCLYRVAQESLYNAVRHSAAKNVRVELTMGADEIHLCISDDGRGFDVESNPLTSTLGLVSMRERVRLVHGRIDIASKPGAGTRIRVRIPLTKGTET